MERKLQVQIPKDLLLALFQYHLAGNEEYLPEIEKALMETEMLQEEIGSEQVAATFESGKRLSEPEIEEKLKDGNQEEKNERTINESDLTSATETEYDFLTNT